MNKLFFLLILCFSNLVNAQQQNSLQHIGGFSKDGEYVKDYFIIKEKDSFHLFYNVGDAGATQLWEEPDNEKAFGHATSKDLQTWNHQPRILKVIPNSWEGQVVSAPSIVKYQDTFYMVYTGFDDRIRGKQSVGLATSTDLYNWQRCQKNPIAKAPAYTKIDTTGWLDFRDAHIIRYKNEFLLFTMTTSKEGKGVIAIASSDDAVNWKELGPALTTFKEPESPCVFEHKGFYYMFVSNGNSGFGKLFKTQNPTLNNWREVPFNWPSVGIWSGWEVLEYKNRIIFSAFQWKLHGNFIRFWEIDWNDDIPVIRY